MPVAICTRCGARAVGTVSGPDDYNLAIPGHPFGGRCPTPRPPTFDQLLASLRHAGQQFTGPSRSVTYQKEN